MTSNRTSTEFVPPRAQVKRESAPSAYPRVVATYRTHPVSRFNQNPLIMALPALPDEVTLGQSLTYMPDYDESERGLDRTSRLMQIRQLSRFYVGLPRVVELVESLHAMICESYVGREPARPDANVRRQDVYDRRQRGEFFQMDNPDNGAEFSSAVLGFPGVGKTQAIKRAAQMYERVIFHPDLGIYQIPVLRIEMSYDGASVHTLADAIFRQLNRLLPECGYNKLYIGSRSNAEIRFMDAVELMQTHYVGALLVDESQNQRYGAEKLRRQFKNGAPIKSRANVVGQTALATLLISASNYTQIPLLLTGTPELQDAMSGRLSSIRRTTGGGFKTWGPLKFHDKDGMGEFGVVLNLLWQFQWTKTSFELTPRMLRLFYYYTQGISDFVVKLFQEVQTRAIRDGGDELVTEELVHEVATNELQRLSEVTRAMRESDTGRLSAFADVAAYYQVQSHTPEFDQDLRQTSKETTSFNEGTDEPIERAVTQVPAGAFNEPPKAARKRTSPAKRTPKAASLLGKADSIVPDTGPFTPVQNFGDSLDS